MKAVSAILFFLLVGACSHFEFGGDRWQKKATEGEFVRYYDRFHGFSIAFPKDWEVTHQPSSKGVKKSFSLIFSAESPRENKHDALSEKVGVVVIDLDRFSPSEQSEQKENKTRDATQIAQTGALRIQDYLARWYISKAYTSKDGLRLQQMGFDIHRDRLLYKIGWVGEASKFSMYKSLVEKIVYSIKFQ